LSIEKCWISRVFFADNGENGKFSRIFRSPARRGEETGLFRVSWMCLIEKILRRAPLAAGLRSETRGVIQNNKRQGTRNPPVLNDHSSMFQPHSPVSQEETVMLYRQMISTVGVIGLVLTFVSSAHAEKYPRMVAALGELKEAHREMNDAGNDFGGHKKEALEATNYAIVQIEKALRAVGVNPVFVPPGKDAYKGYKNFPHIRHALTELQTALREMRDAPTDFGGHKAQAIEATEQAIVQLEKALAAAR
jgi:hypothetical protein